MTRTNDDTPDLQPPDLRPLSTDAAIEQRINDLIGRAAARQMWLIFLNDGDLQLPLMIPIDQLPSRPNDDHSVDVMGNVRDLMQQIRATSLVVVFERWGAREMNAADIAWSRSIADACLKVALPLRAMLLSHRNGVRWIAPDDYR